MRKRNHKRLDRCPGYISKLDPGTWLAVPVISETWDRWGEIKGPTIRDMESHAEEAEERATWDRENIRSNQHG